MNPWRNLGNLPREVWVLFAAILVNRAGTMALPFLVLYLTRGLEFPPERAGLVLAVYGVGALVAAPLSGWLTDRVGPVRVMRASLLLSGAILVFLPLSTEMVSVSLLTLAWSVTNEAFRPASLAVVGDLVPPEQRKAAFAVIRLAINLGMSIGPALGGFIATVSYPAIFVVDGVTSVLAGCVLVAVRWSSMSHDPSERSGPPLPSPAAVRDRRLLLFLGAVILVGLVFFQHEAAMAVFIVRDLHLSESTYGLLFTVNTFIIIALEVPLNSAMARWRHSRALMLGALLCGAGFGGLAMAIGFWSVVATVVIWTFGEMILFPTMAAYVADISPAERRGEYMGLYSMAFSLSFAVGPWAGTVVLDRFGGLVLWPACFVLCTLAAVTMLRMREDRLAEPSAAAA